MKLKIVLLSFFLVPAFCMDLCSQSTVHIHESTIVQEMMNSFITRHKAEDYIRGWRIQIITTDDRRMMEKARAKFSALYPDIPVKWEHISPYYKVQVGAYEKKLDLQGFLLDLKQEFPTAIPVLDDVLKTELVSIP